MAGDYIVWTKGLARKREIGRIMRATGMSRGDAAVTVMEFWEWVDSETADGLLAGLDVRTLSALHADICPGFFQAMVDAGWLAETPEGVVIPRFHRWMGKSAKRRLADSHRKFEAREKAKGQAGQGDAPGEGGGDPAGEAGDVRKMSAPDADIQADKSRPNRNRDSNREEEQDSLRSSSSEASTDASLDQPVLKFPCLSGTIKKGKPTPPKEWPLTAEKVAEYQGTYPAIDVLAECRKALQWVRDNWERRKTFKGMPVFLNKWLAKAQNQAGRPAFVTPARPARASLEELSAKYPIPSVSVSGGDR